MLTGGILTWFGMFGAENASSDALQCICDLSMCCCCNYSFWLSFRRSTDMFDACFFIYVWQVVSRHDLACLESCCFKHLWQAVCRHVLISLISENVSGGPLPCFGMFVVACFGMFVSARWYPDMFWHACSPTCLCLAFANICDRCYTDACSSLSHWNHLAKVSRCSFFMKLGKSPLAENGSLAEAEWIAQSCASWVSMI